MTAPTTAISRASNARERDDLFHSPHVGQTEIGFHSKRSNTIYTGRCNNKQHWKTTSPRMETKFKWTQFHPRAVERKKKRTGLLKSSGNLEYTVALRLVSAILKLARRAHRGLDIETFYSDARCGIQRIS